jgi:hypothetical protein
LLFSCFKDYFCQTKFIHMKKIFFFASAIVFLAACNNTPTPATETHTESTHEQHDHDMAETEKKDTTAILPNQKVFFANLVDGQEIKLPYIVKFGVEGMEVEPAMGVVANKGHHHLLVDQQPVPANTMVPMQKEAEGYFHFGKGQLQDTLNLKKYAMLTPGKHTLTLQFANGMHMSYGPAMSRQVTVMIKK